MCARSQRFDQATIGPSLRTQYPKMHFVHRKVDDVVDLPANEAEKPDREKMQPDKAKEYFCTYAYNKNAVYIFVKFFKPREQRSHS